ncbi:hypothetical protein Vadar_024920 [Vaccinium darrowii]|uniref:Uncharacterized protein n=1 Tax=Vaccinium darrowii TaxID=229202 RepID=A0ACB7X3M0_9ERIC|nr:hypothetical protein Vadar_024920 [Vaccinium darrowii]
MPMVLQGQSPQDVDIWFKNRPKMKEQVTKLHFYFYDKGSVPNPTAVRVAQANLTAQSSTGFGAVVVIDDALTAGPETNSTIVGRAQGTYVFASLVDPAAEMSLSFVFSSGPYNGSTLSLLGHNPVLHTYREMPIVGGTGVFRLARGIATAKTYALLPNFDAIVEYNVVVLHY